MLISRTQAALTSRRNSKKTQKKRRSTERRLCQVIETLEARQLMAADAAVPSIDLAVQDDVAAWVATPQAGHTTDDAASQAITSTPELTAASASALESMRVMAEQSGEIALGQLDQFAAFAGIVIESPTVDMDGTVTGTTNFGGVRSPVLLQYVGQVGENAAEGSWVLAVKSGIGELIETNSPIESPLDLHSPVIVFSSVSVAIGSDVMSEGALSFYAELYDSDDFTVRLERGVNLLTVATITDGSVASDLLMKAGVEIPEIQIEGVLMGEFTNETVDQWDTAEKDDNFWRDLREGIMLRATLPQIVLNDLPANLVVGDATLVWQSPGTEHDQVYVSVDLDMIREDGSIAELSGRLGIAETPTGTQFRMSATANGIRDAFGVTGLDLDEVKLMIALDTVKTPATDQDATDQSLSTKSIPSVSVGVLADMDINGRHVSIAGRVDFSLAGGTPIRVALRGELESLSSTDLMNFAKRISGLGEVKSSSKTPAFEIRDVVINIAPYGGDAELGIEDGIGVSGELYVGGRLAGRVDGSIDRTGLVPEVRLNAWTRAFALGALSVSDVTIDIQMSESPDDFFIVKGGVWFLGVSHDVDIHIESDYMHYHVTTEVDGLGMVDYYFESSTAGVPHWTYRAAVRNDLSSTLEGKVADNLTSWVREAREDFDKAQDTLDSAQRVVNRLIAERDAAMVEAQADYDRIESSLAKAEAAVASLSSQVNSLRRLESSRYWAWRSAVRSTKEAKWYQYAGRKATEVARYASYRSTQVLRIAAQGSLAAANATMSAVRDSAGWVLDAAGPEFHPEVVRINAELAIKTAALNVAKAAVHAAEAVSTGAVTALAELAEHHDDFFMIDQIRFEGTLAGALADSEVAFQVDYTFMNQEKTQRFDLAVSDFDLDGMVKRLVDNIRDGLES